jgi:hypothetical protein
MHIRKLYLNMIIIELIGFGYTLITLTHYNIACHCCDCGESTIVIVLYKKKKYNITNIIILNINSNVLQTCSRRSFALESFPRDAEFKYCVIIL